MMPNAKLRGRGLYADNSCIIKIFVKAETLESRSVAPDPLERFVRQFLSFIHNDTVLFEIFLAKQNS